MIYRWFIYIYLELVSILYMSLWLLEIRFINQIDIPDEISKIKIEHLELFGKISKEGIERIKRLLPDSDIKINGSRI